MGYFTILNAVLPVFGIILLGAGLRRLNWLTEEADRSLMKIIINVLFPALIFEKLIGNPSVQNLGNLALAPIIGFLIVCFGFGVARLGARFAGLKTASEKATFAFTIGIFNYGFIPLPLAILLFDRETTGILFIHNVGVDVALWTVGLAMLTAGSRHGSWKEVFNAPLAAVVLGVVFTLAGLDPHVPTALVQGLTMLGHCAVPMTLLLIGATISDFYTPKVSQAGLRVAAVACVLRLGLLPLVFIGLIKWLPCSLELKQVMALHAGMPTAVFPILMSKHYGGDIPTAIRIVLGTAVVSMVTMAFWIQFALSLLPDGP